MAEKYSTGDVLETALLKKTSYANGVLAIFSGTQPASADLTENSAGNVELLALITLNGGAFTAGVATNGINFDTPTNGILSKADAETWSGLGLAAAGTGKTATWCRHYSNSYTTGASTTAKRWDGAVGSSSSFELQLTNTTIVEGVPVQIRTYTRTIKQSA